MPFAIRGGLYHTCSWILCVHTIPIVVRVTSHALTRWVSWTTYTSKSWPIPYHRQYQYFCGVYVGNPIAINTEDALSARNVAKEDVIQLYGLQPVA